MRLILVVLILSTLLYGTQVSSSEISSEVGPSPLEQLWSIPTDHVSAHTIRSYTKASIKVEEVYYKSRSYKGKPVKIFGYYCYPTWQRQNLPAILLVHGGGGSAHLERSLSWARRGYAVLTIDLPGKGEMRAASRSTGPNMDVSVLLRTKPDLSYNYLIHAVAATRNGITYLAKRKEVDPERIGMVGLSWGGVITLLTNGQDKRLKTAVNVFGAGYIPEGCTWQTWFDEVLTKEEVDAWSSFIDPKNFLKTQHAPILFITGTNDHCYYLPTFQKSYAEVPVSKKLYLVPNLRHRFLADTQRVVWNWLDNKLKYNGSFPQVSLLSVFMKGKNKLIIPVKAQANRKITSVTLYYALGGPSRWTKRRWQSLRGYYEDGIYYFGISTTLIRPDMLFFVTARDSKGGATSTPVRSLFEVKLPDGGQTIALSAPIKRISIHEKPLKLLGMKDAPEFPKILFSKVNRVYKLINQSNLSTIN